MNRSNHLTQLMELSQRAPISAEELQARLNDDTLQAGFIHQLEDMVVDFSRQSVRADELDALVSWGQEILPQRDAMLSGAVINKTENRPALHTLLRDADNPAAQDNITEMAAMAERILALGVEDVVAIGIGGSYLGPAMVVAGLLPFQQGPDIHFVANLDPSHLNDSLMMLNPLTTAVIAISKSFTTKETLVNMDAARAWFNDSGVDSEERVFAVTACPDIAVEANVAKANILTMDDGVGGRFSLWSAAGLPVMVAIGEEMFTGLIAGAEQMDKHFASAPVAENIPILGALIQIWNRSFRGYFGQAVIPYDQRLSKLPLWLQQLMMESNGKSVTAEGKPVELATAPIIFGETGSNAQHSFFQMIHQSNDLIPVDFLAPMTPIPMMGSPADVASRHRDLIAQMLAQADCLALGDLGNGFSGGRPSTLITWSSTTPFALGRLLAYYEHLTVSCGWLLGINSFDQPGVELGKKITADYVGYMDKTAAQSKDVSANSKKYLDQLS